MLTCRNSRSHIVINFAALFQKLVILKLVLFPCQFRQINVLNLSLRAVL